MAAGNTVNTAHLDRRKLHFTNLDQALAEAERLAAADRQGKAKCLGNWTLGQNFNHLATWIYYSYEELPFKIPLFIRLVMRPMKNRFLHKGMPAGTRLPKVPGGTLGTEPIGMEEGLTKFKTNVIRLKGEAPTKVHPLFGKLAHQDWIDMHLRHAELHFSFVNAN